ncbi:MAG TPA: Coenzyme F420 hydrogenase/dehydrogenase, beta subunit C-terminal domain [Pseudolysinimonas sp.]|nr:Coenzyme F420 hydrogenase/dehydrogenase, beta subunit C-terminal domain [Pseudolysinimonas sp.]
MNPITDQRERVSLDVKVASVLSNDSCSGCGACTLLDSGLTMRESAEGYLRPVRVEGGSITSGAASRFSTVCPGVTVRANTSAGTRPHPTMGAYVGVWKAWATDPEIRYHGSSGGTLTALSTWLLETGQAARVTGAAAGVNPRRSVPVTLSSRADALAAAGSRYTPVAALANPEVLAADTVIIGKPCEASAISELHDGDPLVLSFFCAGTPSARATDQLLRELQIEDAAPVDELWYRGRGWPGEFTATSGSTTVRADYDEAWGRVLGPTTQWRCKVCADGVGERADIVAADHWEVDERGYPSFAEGAGVSALIARTPRGLETIMRAVADGVIHIEALTMDSLAAVQPLQRDRRRFLAARLMGSRLAGRRTPKYRGFGLLALSLSSPRQAVRVLRGTFRRVRQR